MAYYGNAPADVALVVGQDVITTTEIQDATIATADIASDAITATKVDDDGTGFQMGSLGLGTAVSGSHKLTVGGTATFSGDITGTLATASQTNITSVGTLTSLTVSGAPFVISNTNNGNNIDIKTTSSGSLVHAVKIHSGGLFEAKQGVSSTTGTFSGDVNVSGQKIRISNSSTNAKIEIDSGGGHDAWIDIAKGSVNWTIQNTGALSFRHEGSEKMNLTSAGDVTFGGRLYTTDGSASYPSYSFSSDSNTGMYLGTADTLRFATGGVERLEITSAQTKVTGDFITTGGIQSKGTNGNNPTGDWYDVKQKFLTYEHDVTPTHVNDGYFSVSHGISRGNILGVIPHHYGYGGTNVNNFGITSGFVEKVIMYANATLRVYIGSSVVASDKIYLTMIVEGNTG